MADDARVPGLESRVATLESERGPIAADLATIRTQVGGIEDKVTDIGLDVRELREALSERPSSVEFQRLRESVRARALAFEMKTPVVINELEYTGPAWIGRVKLAGYSGVTVFAILLLLSVAVVAYLVSR